MKTPSQICCGGVFFCVKRVSGTDSRRQGATGPGDHGKAHQPTGDEDAWGDRSDHRLASLQKPAMMDHPRQLMVIYGIPKNGKTGSAEGGSSAQPRIP